MDDEPEVLLRRVPPAGLVRSGSSADAMGAPPTNCSATEVNRDWLNPCCTGLKKKVSGVLRVPAWLSAAHMPTHTVLGKWSGAVQCPFYR